MIHSLTGSWKATRQLTAYIPCGCCAESALQCSNCSLSRFSTSHSPLMLASRIFCVQYYFADNWILCALPNCRASDNCITLVFCLSGILEKLKVPCVVRVQQRASPKRTDNCRARGWSCTNACALRVCFSETCSYNVQTLAIKEPQGRSSTN